MLLNKTKEFKRVPAVEKCFRILELLANRKDALGITEISRELNFNKSTVYNIVNTLSFLGFLESLGNGKFCLGTRLCLLGKAACRDDDLIHIAHPYLEEISSRTKLSTFLGILSNDRVLIIDKVDSPFDIKVSSEVGMRIPLLAGATGKIFLAQMPDQDVDLILKRLPLKKYTPNTCVDVERYKHLIAEVRKEGVGIDKEEYIEGIRALAVPIHIPGRNLLAGMWVVGLANQIKDEKIPFYSKLLKHMAKEVEGHLSTQDPAHVIN